jgi:hypothetical protein
MFLVLGVSLVFPVGPILLFAHLPSCTPPHWDPSGLSSTFINLAVHFENANPSLMLGGFGWSEHMQPLGQ